MSSNQSRISTTEKSDLANFLPGKQQQHQLEGQVQFVGLQNIAEKDRKEIH